MSKLSKLGHFFQKVGAIAPVVLMFTPLAPIAGPITAAIMEAESIGSAKGEDKLAHVVAVAKDAADVANAAAGKQVVDPAAIDSAAGQIVSGIVTAANGIGQS